MRGAHRAEIGRHGHCGPACQDRALANTTSHQLAGSGRTILFLQGPTSPFFTHLADRVADAGAKVLRVNLCPGDALYWRRPGAIAYRGRPDRWPGFVTALMTRETVTDLVLVGDCRFYHATAIEAAQGLGVRVHSVELGLLRPDWLTVEPDGSGSFSRFPREPDAIRALAADQPLPRPQRFPGSFTRYATLDVSYHLVNLLLAPLLYRHYRPHGVDHPLVEYPAWILKLIKAPFRRARRERQAAAVLDDPAPFMLMPLQLRSDFQVRVHAPDPDLPRMVETIIRSFAANARQDLRLVFKVHPLDNELTPWGARIDAAARVLGVESRVSVLEAGHTGELIRHSAGVVTINSTVGLTAVKAGRPVITLGNAVYDVPGVTSQLSLDRFWREAEAPGPDLRDALLRALAATTQVPGTFDGPGALVGADAVAARILDPVSLPPARQPRAPRPAYRRDPAGNPI